MNRALQRRWRAAAEHGERGAAVVEFVMVSVLLIVLLFGVLQVAAIFYVRNVIAASVADGARYAADQDVPAAAGAQRTRDLIRQGTSGSVASRMTCVGDVSADAGSGLTFSRVRCTGRIHSFFVPVGTLVRLDLVARSVKEQ